MNYEQRDPNVTYKVVSLNVQPLDYVVTAHPDFQFYSNKSMFRWDTLPEWMRDGILKLDLAGNNVNITGFGEKRGDTYWFRSAMHEEWK